MFVWECSSMWSGEKREFKFYDHVFCVMYNEINLTSSVCIVQFQDAHILMTII